MTHHAAQQQALSACEQGAMCIDDHPGHAVTLMRLRLAHLHPEGWVDAVVAGTAEDGTIALHRWSDGAAVHVWHHTHRSDLLVPGSLVAVHERYGVLAAGEHRLNVAPR
ncbi:hypothetical protein [Amnibacterium kyonggiense]|uniref:Uncharacterized protein n=1 Tax=Amnibacterium kyonggiense TaxID=595671 RepID=A0A4R7FMA7_9MICO|nr:hypothetical protein [Amnibacterium kyonggiense]TDS77602.1 hypothetical protein CLV52_2560 [Amnibacterium kyonggiense]